jgi:hypothetical protein
VSAMSAPQTFGPGPQQRSITVEGDEVRSKTPCCDAEVRIAIRELKVLGEVSVNCPDDGRNWILRWNPWLSSRSGAWIH